MSTEAKRSRKNTNVSTAVLRVGAPDPLTQDQFTVYFLEVLRDRYAGPVTLLIREQVNILFKRFQGSPHVTNRPDALLCVNSIRNSLQLQKDGKVGSGKACIFCGTKRRLKSITLWKEDTESDGLQPNGTFIVNKQYIMALDALLLCSHMEGYVLKALDLVKEELRERVMLYKKAVTEGDGENRGGVRLMTEVECQISLTQKKRELCEKYNNAFMVVWILTATTTAFTIS
jgi:hypothetical protein